MSDETILILVAVGFGSFILFSYLLLRTVEKKYRSQIDLYRRVFATYSFPLLLGLMIMLLVYDPLMGNQCSLEPSDDNSWACKSLAYLVFPLIFSVTYSWYFWAVYRKGWDPLDQATGQGFKPKKRWTFYSVFTLIVFIFLIISALSRLLM